MKIDYEAIHALNAKGQAVQSNDGQNWELVNGQPNKMIVFHANHNGTLSGPYVLSYANIDVSKLKDQHD